MLITKVTQRIEDFATKSKFIYKLTSEYYRWLVRRETSLAGICKDDHVLCIGGGNCPYTAILINKYTGAKVTVIDNDSACIAKSKRFVNNLGLNNIEITECDGRFVSCCDFTIIHLAMQISPKDDVIKCLIQKANNGTKILVRNPKQGVQGFYCPMKEDNRYFNNHVKHGLFSNVANTLLYVVDKSSVNALAEVS